MGGHRGACARGGTSKGAANLASIHTCRAPENSKTMHWQYQFALSFREISSFKFGGISVHFREISREIALRS